MIRTKKCTRFCIAMLLGFVCLACVSEASLSEKGVFFVARQIFCDAAACLMWHSTARHIFCDAAACLMWYSTVLFPARRSIVCSIAFGGI